MLIVCLIQHFKRAGAAYDEQSCVHTQASSACTLNHTERANQTLTLSLTSPGRLPTYTVRDMVADGLHCPCQCLGLGLCSVVLWGFSVKAWRACAAYPRFSGAEAKSNPRHRQGSQ